MYQAVIVLDIDGTLLKEGNGKPIRQSHPGTTRPYSQCGGNSHITQQRPQNYCEGHQEVTLRFDTHNDRHFCWNSDQPFTYANMLTSKVNNMKMISDESPEVEDRCVVLIDDIDIDVDAVISAGYHAIKVDPSSGITESTMNVLQTYLNTHCRRHKY